MLSALALSKIVPAAAPAHPYLVEACERFKINTPQREAAFLAQITIECDEFTKYEESCYYRETARLREVYPHYFKSDLHAQSYLRSTRKVASYVYAGRFGNGNEASQDGWHYRGRCPIMLTFHDNYVAMSLDLFGDRRLELNPDLAKQPDVGFLIAAQYWVNRKCNEFADLDTRDAFALITKAIQGGLRAFDDFDPSDLDTRVDWWEKFRGAYGLPIFPRK